MLESLKKDAWKKLCEVPGKNCQSISISTVAAGTIVRAHTESGSDYLLEIINPLKRAVRFIRHNPKHKCKKGQHPSSCQVNSEFRIGSTIRFGEGGHTTSRIRHLEILDLQPSPA